MAGNKLKWHMFISQLGIYRFHYLNTDKILNNIQISYP